MKYIHIFLLSFGFVFQTMANNLQISDVTINDATHIQFTIQWDNSWKISSGPANWDAVWVFIKYQNCATNYLPWLHVNVSTTSTDHTVDGTILQVDATTDGKGVFIRRKSNGSGNISSAKVVLTMTNVTDASYNYQVNGIEMVYVPQGAFYVGDGNKGASSLYGFCTDNTGTPLQITSAIQNTTGLSVNQYIFNAAWGTATALPKEFPFGYNGYYAMKYEVSQEEYVSFLNTITYDQQLTRFAIAPNSAVGSFVIAGSPNPNNCRNGIRIKTPGNVNNIPAVVGCDLNLNGTFDEDDDGKDVACNWLSWADLMAYLDWAALRPMTEFEFEKICRGTLTPFATATPVVNEYIWGTSTILATNAGSIVYPGASNESSLTVGAGLCAYGVGATTNRGPLRCGFAATSSTNRSQAGAAYYGAMDMAGNVSEQCLGGNTYNYSTFTTANGDGDLSSTGAANTTGWPITGGGNQGGVMRGGDWFSNGWQYCITSNRDWIGNNTNANRDMRVGGRGVRSFSIP